MADYTSTTSDQSLREALLDRLGSDKRTAQTSLRVGILNGIAHLAGQAPSLAIREAAAEIAAQIPGVRGVVNRIEAPGAPSPARVIHLNLDQGRGVSNHDKISE